MDSENKDEITEPENAEDAVGEEEAGIPLRTTGAPKVGESKESQSAHPSDPAADRGGAEVKDPSLSDPALETATEPAEAPGGEATEGGGASSGEPPDASNGVAVAPDESEAVSVIGADGEAATVSEPAPPAKPTGAIPDPSPQREAVVSALFQAERPRPGQVLEVTAPYAEAVAAAVASGLPLGEEVAALAARVAEANGTAVEEERAKEEEAVERGKEHIKKYENVFEHLLVLAENISCELEGLNEEDEVFRAASEEVRAALKNHKKGVEIIQRMIDRVIQRKKNLEEPPPRVTDGLPPLGRPASPEEVAEHVSELCTAYHDARDGNYHILQAVEKDSEQCREQTVQTVRGLLSAVDGIDSGLVHEAESRKSVAIGEGTSDGLGELVSEWYGVYKRLDGHLSAFLEAAGIEAQTAEPGSPFDPDRMEPTGTVPAPDLEEESVAAVSRRGFALHGELVRPMSVEVVRNDT